MSKKVLWPTAMILIAALLLAGCGSGSEGAGASATSSGKPILSATPSEQTPETSASASDDSPDASDAAGLEETAFDIVDILRDRDLELLAGRIDPEHGLRFAPYPHLSDTDLVFADGELPAFSDSTVLNWGTADGSGEPIELTFRDYYDKFVYNQDFAAAPETSVNTLLGQGNIIWNVADVYAGASFVEFHFPGFDDSFDGMDWQSLILVLYPPVEADADWTLAAIVHGQWTI